MGTATIAGYTLNSVIDVQRTATKIVAKQQIPGGVEIVQPLGRTRDGLVVTGILNPSAEITAVQNLMSVAGTTGSYTASVIVAGVNWGTPVGGQTWAIDKVEIKTQAGMATNLPWGKYAVTLTETGP
jgi:hypothetical protein